jgi:hypothetical protein
VLAIPLCKAFTAKTPRTPGFVFLRPLHLGSSAFSRMTATNTQQGDYQARKRFILSGAFAMTLS